MACVVLAMYRPQGSVNKQLEYMGNSGYYNDVPQAGHGEVHLVRTLVGAPGRCKRSQTPLMPR